LPCGKKSDIGSVIARSERQDLPPFVPVEAATTAWRRGNVDLFGANAPNRDPVNTGAQFVFNLRFPGQYYEEETTY
jgi:hypothetical protein